MNMGIFGQVDDYISGLLHMEDKALVAAEEEIRKADIPQISVSANQGKFLNFLAKLTKAKTILEVGTLGGYSTIWMARALPEDGKLISLEIDPKHVAVATKNLEQAGVGHLVEIRLGKAIDLLPTLHAENAGPFDMIFIDADKPPYAEYFQWALKLSHPGTLIIADNVIREGKVLDADTHDEMVKGAQRFNQLLANTKAVESVIIQTVGAKEHDGMALAMVK